MKKLNKIIIGIFMLITTSSFYTNCFAMKNNDNSNNEKKINTKQEKKINLLKKKRKNNFHSQEKDSSNVKKEKNDDKNSFIFKAPENTHKYEHLEENTNPSHKKIKCLEAIKEKPQLSENYMNHLSFTENENENIQPAYLKAPASNQIENSSDNIIINNNNFHNFLNNILDNINTNYDNNNNNNNNNNINNIFNNYMSTKNETNQLKK